MLLITKFNKMIRNKLMWAIFAGIVTVSFVATGIISKSGTGNDQNNRRGVEGKVFGEDFSSREFYTARFFQLDMNDSSSLTPEQNKILRKITWERVAALKKAEELGIKASDEELRDAIRSEPGFAVNGVFSPERYRTFASRQLGTDPDSATQIYEQYLRERLVLHKLFTAMRSAVWTSPNEVNRRLSDLTDNFTVEFAKITEEIDAEKLAPTDEQVKKFFDENIEMFRVPQKASVRYVEFPIEDFVKKTDISETDINEFYNRNLQTFSVIDTNGASIPKPLDEVREEIVTSINNSKAQREAIDAADLLIERLQPNQRGSAPSFDAVVVSMDLTVKTTAFFTVNGPVPEMETASEEFCRIAFSLDKDNPDRYFSDPVASSNIVYVMAADAIQESHLPKLEDVIETASAYAKVQLLNEKQLEQAEKSHEDIAKHMDKGKTFTESVTSLGFNVSTTEPFNVYEGIVTNDFEHSDVIIRGIVSLDKGQMSEPLNTFEGTLVAYVVAREPGDALMMQSLKPQFLYTVEGYRLSNVYDDWAEQTLASAGLDDYYPIKIRDNDEEDKEEEENTL